MQNSSDINQEILKAIHAWEADHENLPPTRLQLSQDHEQEFDSPTFSYRGHAIKIDYVKDMEPGRVRCGLI